MQDEYPVTTDTRVRQLRDKASYDRQTVHAVLDAGLFASVGFVQQGRAVVVPMIYGRDRQKMYLHGARKARVIRLLEESDRVCVNVTLVDGIVFARSAFNSSMHYRSATLFGKPQLVEGREDKLHALRIISEHTMPGRWDELREPLEREIKMTGIIAIDIESASAKISTGMPQDEDEDYDIPIWAGVLPVQTALMELQPDDRLLDGVAASEALQALEDKVL